MFRGSAVLLLEVEEINRSTQKDQVIKVFSHVVATVSHYAFTLGPLLPPLYGIKL